MVPLWFNHSSLFSESLSSHWPEQCSSAEALPKSEFKLWILILLGFALRPLRGIAAPPQVSNLERSQHRPTMRNSENSTLAKPFSNGARWAAFPTPHELRTFFVQPLQSCYLFYVKCLMGNRCKCDKCDRWMAQRLRLGLQSPEHIKDRHKILPSNIVLLLSCFVIRSTYHISHIHRRLASLLHFSCLLFHRFTQCASNMFSVIQLDARHAAAMSTRRCKS